MGQGTTGTIGIRNLSPLPQANCVAPVLYARNPGPILGGMKPETPNSTLKENPFKLVEDLKKTFPHLWRPAAPAPKARYDRKEEDGAFSREAA